MARLRFTIRSRYQLLLMDPPWHYPLNGAPSGANGAAMHYDLMSDADILAMPVREWLEDRAALFLWATGPRLDMAMTALHAWGLHYRGLPFIWAKTRKDGELFGAKGPAPTSVKATTELVLLGATVRKGRPIPLADMTVRQVILAPITKHSEKPDAVAHALERMYPDASRAEVFARKTRPGWDTYGDGTEAAPPPAD